MKNLVLDFGNTNLKLAVFELNQMTNYQSFSTLIELISFTESLDFDQTILSSVLQDSETQFFLNDFKHKVIEFNYKMNLPLKIKYESADTLGKDRLANACFGAVNKKGNNILIIDVGTCIKFDFVNDQEEYLGGSIAPGINLRLKSLSNYTGKLPLVSFKDEYRKLIGVDTNGSILTGVKIGIEAEINGMIQMYEAQYPNLTIFITGGDSDKFELQSKNSIFADNFITLKGLNEILLYNK